MATINSITINGQAVSFKYGLTISDVLSKELNTGLLVIPQTVKLVIEPLDEVVITHNVTQIIRMVVAQINAKITNHEGSKKYIYTIGLASPTLKLQRIVLPSRSITNSLDGSADLTIYQALNQYRLLYAPTYTFSSALISKTNTVPCPEFSWTRPTLFEVFNDLLGVIGCVVTLTGNTLNSTTISLLDLYEAGSQIDETKINNYEFERNVAEYANKVEIQASNVYDTTTNTTAEWVNVRTTQSAVMTDKNQELVLSKPIFQIKKVIAKIVLFGNTQSYGKEIDITNRVVEKTVYDTFYNSNNAGRLADTSTKKYRRNYAYYSQGSNIISGLDYKEEDWIPYNQPTIVIDNILYWEFATSSDPLAYLYDSSKYQDFLAADIVFYIEYLAADDVTFRVKKDFELNNESVLINGQTSAEVYAMSLGKQQQEFVNRIGNEEMIITGRYTNYNDIPNLNDYIDDYILTQREIAFNDGFYNFKGLMSQHYAKDNMFAGISTSKRYTEIASPNKALISNHLTEQTVKLSATNGNTSDLASYLINLGKADEALQGSILQTITDLSFDGPQYAHTLSPKFLIGGSAHIVGNSLIYNARMEDNANVGLSIDADFYVLNIDRQVMVKNSYVNDLGRFHAIAFRVYKKGGIRNRNLENLDFPINFGVLGDINFTDGAAIAGKLPVVSDSESYRANNGQAGGQVVTYNPVDDTKKVFSFTNTGPFSVGGLLDYKRRYKDNREITSETLQVYITRDSNVFFTDLYFDYTPFIYKQETDATLKIAYSTTETYTSTDTVYKGTLVSIGGLLTITKSGNNIGIAPSFSGQGWYNTNATSMVSWAICDSSGKIIIARNGNLTQKIYANVV